MKFTIITIEQTTCLSNYTPTESLIKAPPKNSVILDSKQCKTLEGCTITTKETMLVLSP